MEIASDGEICAAMNSDALPCMLMHSDALSIGHVSKDSPINSPCVCDHPVFFENSPDRCISCGRLTPAAQHELAVRYINELEEGISTPHYQCGSCGSTGPFKTIRDEYNGDYDIECPECGSVHIYDTPQEAFRALQEKHEADITDGVMLEISRAFFFLNKGPSGSRTERVQLELDVVDPGFETYGGRMETEVYLKEISADTE